MRALPLLVSWAEQDPHQWRGGADFKHPGLCDGEASRHLCIFTIKNGVFGMQPALPVDSSNGMSNGPPYDQIFTKGNILEGSYSELQERRGSARFRLCGALPDDALL